MLAEASGNEGVAGVVDGSVMVKGVKFRTGRVGRVRGAIRLELFCWNFQDVHPFIWESPVALTSDDPTVFIRSRD